MSAVSEYQSTDGWNGNVCFAPGPDGFAYRPGQLITAGVDAALRMFPRLRNSSSSIAPEPVFPEDAESLGPDATRAPQLFVLRGEIDPIDAAESLRAEGILAQPNHVFFAHGDGCAPPHPAQRWAAYLLGGECGSGLQGSPFHGSPFHGSPFHGSPFHGSPFHGSSGDPSELQRTGRQRSSARPANGLPPSQITSSTAVARPVTVAILDTGMAADGFRPAALDPIPCRPEHREVPDRDGDRYLDSTAGHGTFIAGLVQLLAPGCSFVIEQVLTSYGDGEELLVARRIHELAGKVDIINMSFGGYASERMHVLATAVRRAQSAGTVVVASAGNDATNRRTYPAALRDVIGVGALGPGGPAPFTNFGPWVRACAPGVDLVSWFFSSFDGPDKASPGVPDSDHFAGWARWSGTSFSGPVVVAALAREMLTYGVSAAQAVQRVVDGPGLLQIPDLGTVVNLA